MIALGCDHGGFALKEELITYLTEQNLPYRDFGCDGLASCDYPAYAKLAAEAVACGDCTRGIVICTTGVGISIAANKVHGARCALCTDPLTAELSRRHNDANMLALGAGIVGPSLALRIVDVFLNTDFEAGRHARRVGMIAEMDRD